MSIRACPPGGYGCEYADKGGCSKWLLLHYAVYNGTATTAIDVTRIKGLIQCFI